MLLVHQAGREVRAKFFNFYDVWLSGAKVLLHLVKDGVQGRDANRRKTLSLSISKLFAVNFYQQLWIHPCPLTLELSRAAKRRRLE